jgi:magnesium transporter
MVLLECMQNMSKRGVKLSGRMFDSSDTDREVEVKVGMAMPSKTQLLWIDSGRDADDLAVIDEVLGLSGGVTRLEKAQNRPQIVNSKEYVRLRVVGIESGSKAPVPVTADIIARTNLVVTIHDRDIEGLGLPVEAAKSETELGVLDESAFVALLLDGMLTGYFRAVERIEKQIDVYDERALRSQPDDGLISELVALRREIALLRRALNPQREVFYSLERPGIVLGDSEKAAWPLLADRFRQAIEAVENARELLVGCFDIVISRTGQRTNDVMRVLTVVSSVLLPAVVIAGLMGMNFKPPIFDDPSNFYIVIAATAVLAITILVLARWRHWV